MCQFLLWGEVDLWRVSKEVSGRLWRLYPSGNDAVKQIVLGSPTKLNFLEDRHYILFFFSF